MSQPCAVIEVNKPTYVIEQHDACDVVEQVVGSVEVIEVGLIGPQGSIGLQGPAGPAGTVADYTQTFSSAAGAWTVNHNLGREPVIQVISVGGVELLADVVHVSQNQAQVNFATPTAGRVRAV